MSESTVHLWHVQGIRWESIPHHVLRDRELTFRARGLLCYLLSLLDDWKTSVDRLRRETPAREPGRPYEGREALESAVREIERRGYLYRWPRRNNRGHLEGYVWAFSADRDELRKQVGEHVTPLVDNQTGYGSAVDGSPGNGSDQDKHRRSAGRAASGSTVDGSPASITRTISQKNSKKNLRQRERAPKARSPLPPPCGQCEAQPGDTPAARFVELDDGRTAKCPRCHPAMLHSRGGSR